MTSASGFNIRYGEPDWDEPPREGPAQIGIRQRPLSDKSYEELRYEATQKQWASKFVSLNTMALASAENTSFVFLKNLTNMVEVVVGEGDEQARWMLHEKLLTADSEFAKMALSRDFKEKNERIIRFPEEDPDVFGQYVTFLYGGMIFTFNLEQLVQMYTLGDRLQSLKFANSCYESISKSTDAYTATQIRYVFDHTYNGDRLRKEVISQVGKGILRGRYTFSLPHEQEQLKDCMPELMQGVTAAVTEARRGGGLDKWYPKPQSSPPYSPPTATPTLFGTAPARPPAGGLFGTGGLFGSRPSNPNGGGGLFSGTPLATGHFGAPQASTMSSGGGLFNNNPTTATSGGGLYGNPAAGSGGAGTGMFGGSRTTNTTGGLFGNSSATTGGRGLFGNVPPTGGTLFGAAPPSTGTLIGTAAPATGTLFGIATPVGASQYGAASYPSTSSSGSLFNGTTGVSHMSLFGPRSAPQPASGTSRPDDTTASQQSTQPQNAVNAVGETTGTGAQATSTIGETAQAPITTTTATQTTTTRPSLFGSTSAVNPFAAAQPPTGPPAFGFPRPVTQTAPKPFNFADPQVSPQTPQEQQASAATSSAPGFSFARFTSDSNLRTGRDDISTLHKPFSFNPHAASSPHSPPREVAEDNADSPNTDDNEKKDSTTDAASLAALQAAFSRTHQNWGVSESDLRDQQVEYFSTRQHFGQPSTLGAATGWRPAENGQPSRLVGFPSITNTSDDNDESGKGKQPATIDDAALSRDFMNLAFPGVNASGRTFSIRAVGDGEEYLKNSHGGKITRDDKLSPSFEEYLRNAKGPILWGDKNEMEKNNENEVDTEGEKRLKHTQDEYVKYSQAVRGWGNKNGEQSGNDEKTEDGTKDESPAVAASPSANEGANGASEQNTSRSSDNAVTTGDENNEQATDAAAVITPSADDEEQMEAAREKLKGFGARIL